MSKSDWRNPKIVLSGGIHLPSQHLGHRRNIKEFRANLSYEVSSKSAGSTQNLALKPTKTGSLQSHYIEVEATTQAESYCLPVATILALMVTVSVASKPRQ